MSYSRWSDGEWYTFWHTNEGVIENGKLIDKPNNDAGDQLLALWHLRDPTGPVYSFKQLTQDPESVFVDICSRIQGSIPNRHEFNDIVSQFITDVQSVYAL